MYTEGLTEADAYTGDQILEATTIFVVASRVFPRSRAAMDLPTLSSNIRHMVFGAKIGPGSYRSIRSPQTAEGFTRSYWSSTCQATRPVKLNNDNYPGPLSGQKNCR